MTEPSRFDLGTLEFSAVREILIERLTTTLGRREVETLAPYGSPEAANEALQRATELARRAELEQRPPVAGSAEVRSWLASFFDGEHQPNTRDLADLKRLLRATARCKTWLGEDSGGAALASMSARFPQVADIAGELEGIVDDRGEVLTSASVRLVQIRREIDVAETGVRTAVARFVADDRVHSCLQSLEPSWRHGRPVFQVRYEMRHRVAGVLHDRSQSGATLFVEPSLIVEAANRLSDARAAEHREVQVVLTHVCRGLRRCRAEIEQAVAVMSALDVDMARARLIRDDGYVAAPVVREGPLRLRGALHPILLRTHEPVDQLVPLDVTLGDPYHMLVITGPNTGGKTVALKTIGLLSAMAMCGVPIPALEGSQVPSFDGVFVDIGDEQGISQNLSTFSSHVKRIVRCLSQATPSSLVLIDELGAGTDPEEGGALGYAVLESLETRGIRAVVTTHLGRLKDFAYAHTGAENGAMAFDGETLRPLYRMHVGIPGSSHALDIAGRVGMPDSVVDRARALMVRGDRELENVIGRVQEARTRADAERQRTEELGRKAEQIGVELEEKRNEITLRKAWLEEEAAALVEEELRTARELLQRPLVELANAPKPFGETARKLLESLSGLMEGTSVHRRRMRFVGSVRKNDMVYIPRLKKRCTVKKVDRAREVFSVEVGKLRMEVPFEDVSWLQPLDT